MLYYFPFYTKSYLNNEFTTNFFSKGYKPNIYFQIVRINIRFLNGE